MAQGLIDLNDGNFADEISSGITLVDFWAPWCGPCKMQTPILETLAGKVEEGVTIAKVNVDESPTTAGQFGVRSIPTIILFKDGKPAQQMVGLQQESALLKAIESAQE